MTAPSARTPSRTTVSRTTLSRRALNRATLARQMLLERSDRTPLAAVEHLLGLQAQAPFPPYFGLWSRLRDFAPESLARLLTDRAVVRLALMRSTVHLVSAADAVTLRALVQPVLVRAIKGSAYGRQLSGVDPDELVTAARALLAEEPLTANALGERLRERWPDVPEAALANGVRAYLPLAQVTPRGVWGRSGQAKLATLDSWVGRVTTRRPSLDGMVLRYLGAFGPASVADIQAWCGLTKLAEVVDRLRPKLVTFGSESGGELFDLPDAPRPDPETPAPVRLVAEYDNLTLSHADRTRMLSEEDRRRLWTRNGVVPGLVLVDGFAAGLWRLTTARGTATTSVETFRPVPKNVRGQIVDEAAAMLRFAAPSAAHDVTFAPAV